MKSTKEVDNTMFIKLDRRMRKKEYEKEPKQAINRSDKDIDLQMKKLEE